MAGVSDKELLPEQRIIGAAPVSWALSVIATTGALVAGSYFLLDNNYKATYGGQIEGLRQEVASLKTTLEGRDVRIQELERDLDDGRSLVDQAREVMKEWNTQQIEKLQSELSKSGGTESIRYWVSGGEAAALAAAQAEFIAAFEHSGWETIKITDFTKASDPLASNSVVLQPASAESLFKVEDALSKAEIDYVKRPPSPGTTIDQIWVPSWEDAEAKVIRLPGRTK